MLTMRTSICLNLLPIPSNKAPNASLIPTKSPQEGWWRRQCIVIGVASCCTIIGLELCNSVTLKHEVVAIAKEEEIMFVSSKSNPLVSVSVGGAKWSEKRACLPWRGNSLETIVPENLPRPAARRRYEDVHSTSKTAPPLSHSIIIKHKTNTKDCFSM